MVRIGDSERQPAALELEVAAPDDGAIADLDLVERGNDARLRVRDGAPAVVYPREAF